MIHRLYEVVDELKMMFPGRHFTPDGHMVGSLGEAIAEYYYGIVLSTASAYCHDGVCDGKNVQIKATQGSRIGISSEPECLLVLRISRDGTFEEIYNGPGSKAWKLVAHKPRPKNGQYQISLNALRELMDTVSDDEKLVKRVSAQK